MFSSPKYEVISELGRGGAGIVYKVRHVTLEVVLAVKVLSPELSGDSEFTARFEREARVMARLVHPNIVRVLDIDAHDGVRFIVMELVDGANLEQLLRQRGRLPLAETLRHAEQVARALAYAHTHADGVIHRDIKPSNVIIETATGRTVVTDFGIAKLAGQSDQTRSSSFLGTLRYCAPEQARGESVDGRVDVYGLGLVLYEMLTGVALYGKLTGRQVLARLIAPGETPLQFPDDCPEAVRSLIARATARDREQRFPTAAACLAAITEVRRELGLTSGDPRAAGVTAADDRTTRETRQEAQAMAAALRTIANPALAAPDEGDGDDAWVLGGDVLGTGGEREPSPIPSPARVVADSGGAAPAPRGFVGRSRPFRRSHAAFAAAGAISLAVAALWLVGGPDSRATRSAAQIPPQAVESAPSVAPQTDHLADRGLGRDVVPEPAAAPTPASAADQAAASAAVVGEPATEVANNPGIVLAAPERTQVSAAAPKEKPLPRLVDAAPTERRLSLHANDTIEFRARGEGPDGNQLPVTWSVDNRRVGTRPSLRYEAPAGDRPATHTIVAEVATPAGTRDRLSWQVAVAAAARAPRLVRVTPTADRVTITTGRPRLFTVDAELPGADDPLEGLTFEWRLDETLQSGSGDRFELTIPTAGDHRLVATVRAPGGATVSREWRVSVEEAADDAAPKVVAAAGPAEVDIVDLSDTPTRDKRSLLVQGQIRNRGGGAIERLVVIVQALDEAGNVVAEEDGVPSPQPLPPGELAFFRVRIANEHSIRGFRVQAFPR